MYVLLLLCSSSILEGMRALLRRLTSTSSAECHETQANIGVLFIYVYMSISSVSFFSICLSHASTRMRIEMVEAKNSKHRCCKPDYPITHPPR